MKALPERGRIGIFNRSHYEEGLVVRVHNELLAKQKLPPKLLTKDVWKERHEDIGLSLPEVPAFGRQAPSAAPPAPPR